MTPIRRRKYFNLRGILTGPESYQNSSGEAIDFARFYRMAFTEIERLRRFLVDRHWNDHAGLFLTEVIGYEGERKEETRPDEISFRSGPDHFVLGCAQKVTASGGQAFQDCEGEFVFPSARCDDRLDQTGLSKKADVIDDIGVAARKLFVLCPQQEISH
jgi:hypothetical protein